MSSKPDKYSATGKAHQILFEPVPPKEGLSYMGGFGQFKSRNVTERNAKCPCGSGLKTKKCCKWLCVKA